MFGGYGYDNVLAHFPRSTNLSSLYGGILLPMDVILSHTSNTFIEWRSVADALVIILLVGTATFLLFLPFMVLHGKRWRSKNRLRIVQVSLVLFRRLLIVVGLNYFFRACVLALTILPPGSLACIPKLRPSLFDKLADALWLIAGSQVCCYDFMYSGHTSLTTVCVWFWAM